MNIEHVEKSYQELESDSTLQNLIAQANARAEFNLQMQQNSD